MSIILIIVLVFFYHELRRANKLQAEAKRNLPLITSVDQIPGGPLQSGQPNGAKPKVVTAAEYRKMVGLPPVN